MAFSYFCEFFSRKTRGPFVIIVASFWSIGQVFAAVLAMPILDSDYMRQNVNSTLGKLINNEAPILRSQNFSSCFGRGL